MLITDVTENKTARPEPPKGKLAVHLSHPIEVKGEQVEYLFLPERVTLRHLKATDKAKGDIEKVIFLIASLAKIPVICAEHIDAMDIQAGSELGDYTSRFLEVSPGTGES